MLPQAEVALLVPPGQTGNVALDVLAGGVKLGLLRLGERERDDLLDARGAISVSERAAFIGRVRNMARACAKAYLEQREKLGFPMLNKEEK